MPWHAKWCAATPQVLIEVNALQTKQGEWRVGRGLRSVRHARPSLFPTSSTHLNFLVSQPTATLRTRIQNIPAFSLPPHPLTTHSLSNIHPAITIIITTSTPHHITTPSHSTASSTCAPSSSSASPRSSRALLVRPVSPTSL